ncbi:MAG: hypothetical protein FJ087_19585 [Deltaproteobacteria bacterium]|nr:hypothetical protein [Deltaproteobacteria bacterium]
MMRIPGGLAVGVWAALVASWACGPGESQRAQVADISALFVRLSACYGFDLADADSSMYGIPRWSKDPGGWIGEWRCVGDAVDCAGVDACLGFKVVPACSEPTAVCLDAATVLVCVQFNDGAALVEARMRCPGGSACISGADIGHGTRFGWCGVPSRNTCEGLSCAEGVAFSCVGGVVVRDDCGSRGLRCLSEEGVPRCGVPGKPAEVPACAGDVWTWNRGSYDCGWLGKTCLEGHRDGFCFPVGESCTGGAVRCSGSVAAVCVEGDWLEFDCSGFAGSRCEVEDAELEKRVRCTVPGRYSPPSRDDQVFAQTDWPGLRLPLR